MSIFLQACEDCICLSFRVLQSASLRLWTFCELMCKVIITLKLSVAESEKETRRVSKKGTAFLDSASTWFVTQHPLEPFRMACEVLLFLRVLGQDQVNLKS